MNSLSYLSRKLDVLATTGPAAESASELSGKNESTAKLKRTRTWNKPFLHGLQASSFPRTQRSFSLPAFPKPVFTLSTVPASRRNNLKSTASSGEEDDSPSPELKHDMRRIQQHICFTRALFIIWNTICEAWHYIVKNIHKPWWFGSSSSKAAAVGDSEVDEVTSVEEKDSDESDDTDRILAKHVEQRLVDDNSASSDPSASRAIRRTIKTRYPSTKELPSSAISSNLLPNPFSASLLTQSSLSVTSSRSPSPLPSPRRTPFHLPKTLVLDLDETLIHSTSKPLTSYTGGSGLLGLGGRRNKGVGHMVEVVQDGRSTLYHVYKRPFVDYFLRKVSSWYTLVVFTASMQEYADPVIDWLDAGRGILTRRFFRESCTRLPSGSYIKDLSLIEQDLSRVCLIDNSPISYNINQANGIPIEGWTHDMSDEALLDLLPVLDSLRFTSDVRKVLGIRGF